MKKSSIIATVIGALVLIAIISIISLILKGVFHLAGGLLDTVLGIIIVLALIVLIIWMFRYAAKK